MLDAYRSLLIQFNIAGSPSIEEDKAQLLAYIDYLIVHDFEKLISILYRVDVSETKINHLLKAFPEQQAATIILSLVMERTEEKIAVKKANSAEHQKDSDEEKW